MTEIYERIKNETMNALMKDAEVDTSSLKACTVRMRPEYVQLAEKLAEELNQTRQELMAGLLYDALDEALNAYASVFSEPKKVYKDMRDSCGFFYGNITDSQFYEFCKLNGCDPSDPSSSDEFKMICDETDGLTKGVSK